MLIDHSAHPQALALCENYRQSRDMVDLNDAWECYARVYYKLKKRIPKLRKLNLQHISPALFQASSLVLITEHANNSTCNRQMSLCLVLLLRANPQLFSAFQARDMELAVPGTYTANTPVIRIQSFQPQLRVYNTKQRPRKLTIVGSNGSLFVFILKVVVVCFVCVCVCVVCCCVLLLCCSVYVADPHCILKAHEDLRQDERVMQFFALANSLLSKRMATKV